MKGFKGPSCISRVWGILNLESENLVLGDLLYFRQVNVKETAGKQVLITSKKRIPNRENILHWPFFCEKIPKALLSTVDIYRSNKLLRGLKVYINMP